MNKLQWLRQKYANISAPAKASMWFVFSSVVQKGIALLTTPIFTRILSTEEYGTITIYNSWLSILMIFATMELATGVFNKAMIKYENDRDGYTASTLFLASLFTCVLFVVYLIGHSYWNKLLDLSTPMMIMLFLEILFMEAMSFWSIRRRFEFEYKSVVGLTLLANIAGTLLSIVLVLNSPDRKAEYRVAGTLIVHILVYGVVYCMIMKKRKKLIRLDYWKYALSYNLPLIPHYLSQQILNQSDRIMISRMISMSAAAVYTVAYQISTILNIIITAVHASFAPWAFQKLKEGDNKKIGERAFQIELLICAGCFLCSLFAPEVILILGGQAYYEAIWVIPPVAMSIVFNVLYTLIANVAFYYEKTKFIMFGTVLSAAANIVLNYLFIPVYGFVAAGYTTMICFMLYSIVHYLFMLHICRIERITNPFDGKLMIGIALIAMASSIVSTMLYHHHVVRYLLIVAMGAAGIIFRKKLIMVIKGEKNR